MASVLQGWEDETGRLAERGTDGFENIGGGGSADPSRQKRVACRVPPSVA